MRPAAVSREIAAHLTTRGLHFWVGMSGDRYRASMVEAVQVLGIAEVLDRIESDADDMAEYLTRSPQEEHDA